MKIQFNNKSHSFQIKNVQDVSYLYFPLSNGNQLKSSITPNLNGDIKIDQNHFALLPVSQEDLQNSLFGRHFWINIKEDGMYNLSGISSRQSYEGNDRVDVEGGFLYHTIYRKNEKRGIHSTVTTFSPYGEDNIELTKVIIKNTSNHHMSFIPTVAIPLYSRSADNLRDHRHVTSLLNSATIIKQGIINQPTLSFDERGHVKNDVQYGVYVSENVKAYNPNLEEFMGEGGSLNWPRSLLKEKIGGYQIGDKVEGCEVIGAMQLEEKTLAPNEEISIVFAITIDVKDNVLNNYCNIQRFDQLLIETKQYWDKELSTFGIHTSDENFDSWVKWVSLQPILRRIFGCSFLPHHDYGKGGRGWRDLWQDCLALILNGENDVDHLLFNNFAGVRIDGSNATIIGNEIGEFIADRNNIVRVWMDHGVWPWNTMKLYLERSGDVDFLFKKQSYFKDANIFLGKGKDIEWNEVDGNKQKTKSGNIYQGTILEHLLLQNLIQFYHVGENNNILLDGADWNDGLDMAKDKGESVAFTSFYMMNLEQIANLLEDLKTNGINNIQVFNEMKVLFKDIPYENILEKKELLNDYFSSVKHHLSGEISVLKIDDVIESLRKKANVIKMHLRKSEWISVTKDIGFYNGYYDNHGKPVENKQRMMLTSQVFPIMSGVATDDQISQILNSAKKFLYDSTVAGYRLNTPFNELKLDMGRLFGFAFGHKENGAMFSHMTMMFANALYKRGYTQDAYQILNDIYKHCMNFNKAKIYPGIPEYIAPDGRGMYHYLTGSASWYILNVVNEMFGVQGKKGDLCLNPQLLLEQFDEEGRASIDTLFNNKRIRVIYFNKLRKENYKISNVLINKNEIAYEANKYGIVIKKESLEKENVIIEATLS